MDVETVSIETARRKLGDLVDRARLAGEAATITRHGKPAAMLVPVEWYESRADGPQGAADGPDPS